MPLIQQKFQQRLRGYDTVVSCLSSSKGMKKSTELQDMTEHIVKGMHEHQVERIIYTASAGVHRELTGVVGKLMMWLLKNPLIDHRAAVARIEKADLL